MTNYAILKLGVLVQEPFPFIEKFNNGNKSKPTSFNLWINPRRGVALIKEANKELQHLPLTKELGADWSEAIENKGTAKELADFLKLDLGV